MRCRAAIVLVLTAAGCALAASGASAASPFKQCSPVAAVRPSHGATRPLRRRARHGEAERRAPALARRPAGSGDCARRRPGRRPRPTSSTGPSTSGPRCATAIFVVFDQRGTGLSGALRCRGLFTRSVRNAAAAGAGGRALRKCHRPPARLLHQPRLRGRPRRAVRRAVGVDKITLFGVSYGRRWRSATRPSTPSTWSGWCSTRSWSPAAPGPSRRRASPPSRVGAAQPLPVRLRAG